MGEENTATFTVEKDGAIVVKEGDTPVRYVKESDLLAVKGSKETAESKVSEAVSARETAVKEVTAALDVEKNRALQAEARISSLEEQIKSGGGTAAELEKAKAELVAAKSSSEVLTTKHLELRRNVMVTTYGVPKETVASKDLAALDVYEEALKAVLGDKALGNFAVGGGSGGASALQGKSPMELAQIAYSQSK